VGPGRLPCQRGRADRAGNPAGHHPAGNGRPERKPAGGSSPGRLHCSHRWDRIRINGLDIGWTETEGEDATQRTFHAADDTWKEGAARALPMGKLGQVDEIADFVVFLLSDRSGVVTGSVIDWDQNVFGGLD
jgi:hypothetical protein